MVAKVTSELKSVSRLKDISRNCCSETTKLSKYAKTFGFYSLNIHDIEFPISV